MVSTLWFFSCHFFLPLYPCSLNTFPRDVTTSSVGSAMPHGSWNNHVLPRSASPHRVPVQPKFRVFSQFKTETFVIKTLSPLVLLLLSTGWEVTASPSLVS